MHWLEEHWQGVAALALMGAGVWWMMPRTRELAEDRGAAFSRWWALFLLASRIRVAEGPVGETILFSVFATVGDHLRRF